MEKRRKCSLFFAYFFFWYFFWYFFNKRERESVCVCECVIKTKKWLDSEDDLDAIVGDDDEGATNTTEELGDHALVHALGAFALEDLEETVDGALVDTLGDGLLGLEHHATTDGVEGVVEGHDGGTGGGDGEERGDTAEDSLVVGIGVHVLDLLEAAELTSTVDEGAEDGHGPAGVEAGDPLLADGGGDAVGDARELALADADVGGETGASKVKGVADGLGDGTNPTTNQQIGSELLQLSLLGSGGGLGGCGGCDGHGCFSER